MMTVICSKTIKLLTIFHGGSRPFPPVSAQLEVLFVAQLKDIFTGRNTLAISKLLVRTSTSSKGLAHICLQNLS